MKMKHNRDFRLVPYEDENGEPIYVVRLLVDPYKDVFLQYGEVLLDGKDNLDFSYRLLEDVNDDGTTDLLEGDPKFEAVLFEVLAELMINEEAIIGERPATDQDRTESAN